MSSKILEKLREEQRTINHYYSKEAEEYDKQMDMCHEMPDAREKLFENLGIKRGNLVIEGGVGTGKNFKFYPYGAKYFAVDINPDMLDKARRKALNIRPKPKPVISNARELCFPDSCFDIGILTYALSGMPGNSEVLSEMERVVKKHGKIGVLDFAKAGSYPEGGFAHLSLKNLLSKRKRSEVIFNWNYLTATSVREYGIYVLKVL